MEHLFLALLWPPPGSSRQPRFDLGTSCGSGAAPAQEPGCQPCGFAPFHLLQEPPFWLSSLPQLFPPKQGTRQFSQGNYLSRCRFLPPSCCCNLFEVSLGSSACGLTRSLPFPPGTSVPSCFSCAQVPALASPRPMQRCWVLPGAGTGCCRAGCPVLP